MAHSERDRVLILAGLLLGLRVSELTGLNVEDIDLAGRQIFVARAKGGKQRYVPIPERLAEPLGTWLGARTAGPAFPSRNSGGRLTTRAVHRLIALAGVEAGIQRDVHPHVLRHTFATRCLDMGADLRDIQELLGHSSISTTSIYVHCSSARLKSLVDRL